MTMTQSITTMDIFGKILLSICIMTIIICMVLMKLAIRYNCQQNKQVPTNTTQIQNINKQNKHNNSVDDENQQIYCKQFRKIILIYCILQPCYFPSPQYRHPLNKIINLLIISGYILALSLWPYEKQQFQSNQLFVQILKLVYFSLHVLWVGWPILTIDYLFRTRILKLQQIQQVSHNNNNNKVRNIDITVENQQIIQEVQSQQNDYQNRIKPYLYVYPVGLTILVIGCILAALSLLFLEQNNFKYSKNINFSILVENINSRILISIPIVIILHQFSLTIFAGIMPLITILINKYNKIQPQNQMKIITTMAIFGDESHTNLGPSIPEQQIKYQNDHSYSLSMKPIYGGSFRKKSEKKQKQSLSYGKQLFNSKNNPVEQFRLSEFLQTENNFMFSDIKTQQIVQKYQKQQNQQKQQKQQIQQKYVSMNFQENTNTKQKQQSKIQQKNKLPLKYQPNTKQLKKKYTSQLISDLYIATTDKQNQNIQTPNNRKINLNNLNKKHHIKNKSQTMDLDQNNINPTTKSKQTKKKTRKSQILHIKQLNYDDHLEIIHLSKNCFNDVDKNTKLGFNQCQKGNQQQYEEYMQQGQREQRKQQQQQEQYQLVDLGVISHLHQNLRKKQIVFKQKQCAKYLKTQSQTVLKKKQINISRFNTRTQFAQQNKKCFKRYIQEPILHEQFTPAKQFCIGDVILEK